VAPQIAANCGSINKSVLVVSIVIRERREGTGDWIEARQRIRATVRIRLSRVVCVQGEEEPVMRGLFTVAWVKMGFFREGSGVDNAGILEG
jgi:hypothetical protein